jgi:hypothetical protein
MAVLPLERDVIKFDRLAKIVEKFIAAIADYIRRFLTAHVA